MRIPTSVAEPAIASHEKLTDARVGRRHGVSGRCFVRVVRGKRVRAVSRRVRAALNNYYERECVTRIVGD